jgi:phage terminase small subunit
MPGPLKNARHERFAQELAKGMTHGEAYAAAGYKRDDKNAARLTKNDGVAARIVELKERAAEKAVVTAADIAAQLDEDRAFARKLKQAAAAVSASLGKAKVLGVIIDRQELTGRNGGPIEYRDLSDEEVLARIAAHEAARAEQQTTH